MESMILMTKWGSHPKLQVGPKYLGLSFVTRAIHFNLPSLKMNISSNQSVTHATSSLSLISLVA